MTMKHDRGQETDEQRRARDEDVAEEKLGAIPAAWQTALGADDYDGDAADATAEEVARGDDLAKDDENRG